MHIQCVEQFRRLQRQSHLPSSLMRLCAEPPPPVVAACLWRISVCRSLGGSFTRCHGCHTSDLFTGARRPIHRHPAGRPLISAIEHKPRAEKASSKSVGTHLYFLPNAIGRSRHGNGRRKPEIAGHLRNDTCGDAWRNRVVPPYACPKSLR